MTINCSFSYCSEVQVWLILYKCFSIVPSGSVLSLAVSSNGEQCFSGGIDATIRCWNMPSPSVDPYDTYGKY